MLVLLLEQFPIAGSFGRSHQGPEKESYLSEITQGGTAESGWAPKLLPDPLLSLTGEWSLYKNQPGIPDALSGEICSFQLQNTNHTPYAM